MNSIIKSKIQIKKMNRYILLSSFLSVIFLTIIGCANDETQKVVNYKNLVMADEFDTDGAPNSSIWGYDIGTGANGWGNNELEYYTDRPENIKVENGMLKITAIKEPYMGSSYTSARILSKGKFAQKYGRFEARIKMPYGQGMWPAFWLLGDNSDIVTWPDCGEIDIMEFRGQQPTVINGTVHGPGYFGGSSITKSYTLQNDRYDTDFHVFGIEWGENYINFYVDNALYNQITPSNVTGEWVFDHPFYIIINLAVGGNYVGSPNNQTVFPQDMLIDYVRVYN
jgi:beta-glucanase (GH16 family)